MARTSRSLQEKPGKGGGTNMVVMKELMWTSKRSDWFKSSLISIAFPDISRIAVVGQKALHYLACDFCGSVDGSSSWLNGRVDRMSLCLVFTSY